MAKLLRSTLLIAALWMTCQASRATAQLPPCDTFCNCTAGCFVLNCQVGGTPWTCGDWGICQSSCYCGGQC